MQILVVEDEDLIRDVVVDILESQGHEVLQAESGERALQLCAEVTPDLIFTDVKLPGPLSGWDVDAGRAIPAFPSSTQRDTPTPLRDRCQEASCSTSPTVSSDFWSLSRR